MKKRIISMLMSLAMLLAMLSVTMLTPVSADDTTIGTTYYVSTLHGNDNNDGLSESKPFYSLQKINKITLQPGDRVLLENGSVWNGGYLHLKGSGSEEAPIIVSSYGSGNKPIINTNSQGVWYQNYGMRLDNSQHVFKGYVSSAILLYDVEYIEISDLEITNIGLEEEGYSYRAKLERTGVAAVAQNKGTVDHVYLDNLYVHDVNGNVYDKHMNNGGIYFTVFSPKNESATGISKFNDVIIENCTIENTSRWGLALAYTAYHAQFNGTAISDETCQTYGQTNVIIRNNFIKDVGGDAITMMYCFEPLVEYNVSTGAAKEINSEYYTETTFGIVAAGIWPWKCKTALFQYNECYDTKYNQDAQAWDADSGDSTIYQYNYSHDNEGSCMMVCLGEAYNTVFRYNISNKDLGGILNISGNPMAYIYNNTFYIADGVSILRSGQTGGTAQIENNIFYYTGSTPKEENWNWNTPKASYDNNIYYNYANTPASDLNAITSDPMLADPLSAPTEALSNGAAHRASAFNGFMISENSPAIDAGKVIESRGGIANVTSDFFGTPISGNPDIGAAEYTVVPSYTLGDVNDDGTIDAADAILVLQYYADIITDSDINIDAADTNGDNVVNSSDAILILQYYANIIHEF